MEGTKKLKKNIDKGSKKKSIYKHISMYRFEYKH